MLVPILTQFLPRRRETMPASYLYAGEAGERYQQMAERNAYSKLRDVGLASIAATLSSYSWQHAVCFGVGDGRSENTLLSPLAPLRSVTIHGAGELTSPLRSVARYVESIDFDLETSELSAAPRVGASVGTLLGYTIGNLRSPEPFLRMAARCCEALVIDTPLAHSRDPRLQGGAWASDAEKEWLDAAQRAHHGAVWPVTSKVESDDEGYTVRLLARGPRREVELIRFRRATSTGWMNLFQSCGWEMLTMVSADSPPRVTWLLVAPSLGI